jgi:hypothetical protein
MTDLPGHTADQLQRGRLEQSCVCGRWEAAGAYCSGCYRSMGPEDWYANGDLTRRGADRQEPRGEATTPHRRPWEPSPARTRDPATVAAPVRPPQGATETDRALCAAAY